MSLEDAIKQMTSRLQRTAKEERCLILAEVANAMREEIRNSEAQGASEFVEKFIEDRLKPMARKGRTKRRTNAWLLFCQDERPKVKARRGRMALTDLSATLSYQWKVLPERQKAVYRDRAKEANSGGIDLGREQRRMDQYLEDAPPATKGSAILVKVRSHEGTEDDELTSYKVRGKTRMGRLFNKYCESEGLEPEAMRFRPAGSDEWIHPETPALSLGEYLREATVSGYDR